MTQAVITILRSDGSVLRRMYPDVSLTGAVKTLVEVVKGDVIETDKAVMRRQVIKVTLDWEPTYTSKNAPFMGEPNP